ncbi:MAG: hypothetical protein Q7S57_01290 [bacterium]|nr:hypothetical protein [bacterium]
MTPFSILIGKCVKMIIISAVLAMVATVLIIPRLSQYQDVSVDISIPVPRRPVTNNYEYDGYYALQATDLFSNTLASWFKSPDFVARIYEKANVPLLTGSIRNVEKVFTVKKVSGQFINLSFSAKNAKEANDIGESIVVNVKDRVELLNDNGNSSLIFSVLVGKPLVVLHQRDKYLDALIAGLVVLVFGFNAVIIADAFKNNK